MSQEHNPKRIFINPSIHEEDEPIEIVVSLIKGKYYKHNEYFYDRYTLAPLRMKGDRFEEASFADKLDKMNYDIHTGRHIRTTWKNTGLYCESNYRQSTHHPAFCFGGINKEFFK